MMRVTDIRQKEAEAMVAVAVKSHLATTSTRLLLWCPWYKETCEANGWQVPSWALAWCDSTHHHMRQHKKFVARILAREYRVLAVTIGRQVCERKLLKHGGQLLRDDTYRTDAYYRSLVPRGSQSSRGLALFPASGDLRHPYFIAWLSQRGKGAATHFSKWLGNVDEAYLRGLIDADDRSRIVNPQVARVSHAMERMDRPLLGND